LGLNGSESVTRKLGPTVASTRYRGFPPTDRPVATKLDAVMGHHPMCCAVGPFGKVQYPPFSQPSAVPYCKMTAFSVQVREGGTALPGTAELTSVLGAYAKTESPAITLPGLTTATLFTGPMRTNTQLLLNSPILKDHGGLASDTLLSLAPER